ncbi:unnamed protein product [Rhizopus stolonifer]
MSIEAVQVYSAKELDHEFTDMLKCYRDKETEFNWEAREKAIIRLRGILRGNATEAYLDTLVQGIKQMVDGMIKAVESLRTQLAVKALSLVADVGIYLGKHLDAYIFDQLFMCLMRCAGVTKKMVSSASLQATLSFLKHATFYPKFVNMLTLAMNEKNVQVRLFTMHYTKAVLATHAHHARAIMDRTSCTDQIEALVSKGLNDAAPAVKEIARESFWIFWEYWKIRGEHLLKQLSPAAQKQLEKSKKDIDVISPSNSTLSTGSIGSVEKKSPSPPPIRKTRVPLNKKKSAVGLNKRKNNFWTLLTSDDLALRIDGLSQIAKKLNIMYPYTPHPDIDHIQLENGSRPVDGDALKQLMLQYLKDPVMQDPLSTPESVCSIMLRLLTFDEYLPRLMISDSPALEHAKKFLSQETPDLLEILLSSLMFYGGFGTTGAQQKEYKLPANRRKLTKHLLVWIDEMSDHVWFESDLHLRHALDLLLPLVLVSGSMWHGDLVVLLKHLRLINQCLFDSIVASYEEGSVTKICRALGIHLRLDPVISLQDEQQPTLEQEEKQQEPVDQLEEKQQPVDLLEEEQQSLERKEEKKEQIVERPEIRIEEQLYEPPEEELYEPSKEQLKLQLKEQTEEQLKELPENRIRQPAPEIQVEGIQIEAKSDINQVPPKVQVEKNQTKERPETTGAQTEVQTEAQTEVQTNAQTETQTETPETPPEVYRANFQKIKPSRYLDEIKEEMSKDVRSLDSLSEEEEEIYNQNNNKQVVYNKPHKEEPDLTDVMYDKRMEAQLKSPIPDYFQPTLVPPLSHFSDGHYDQGMILNERSPKTLPISEPNPEKYPEPKCVPFFYPEKVTYPCAIFQSNTRSNTTGVSVRNKTVLLYALIDKLKPLSVDNVSTLSKLTRLLKEMPIRRRWDQGGSEEIGSETWAGGNGDGGNFVELVQSLLPYLDQPVNKWTLAALDCTCHLAAAQSGLLKFFERKSNDRGMTLESQLIERLLELKSHPHPSVSFFFEGERLNEY